MTEALANEQEGISTSHNKTHEPGVFRSTVGFQNKKRQPLFPRMSVDGEIRPPKNSPSEAAIKNAQAKERLLGKIEVSLVDATYLRKGVSNPHDAKKIDSCIKNLELLQNKIGEKDFVLDDIESKLSEVEDDLSSILQEVLASAQQLKRESLQQQEEMERLKVAFAAQSAYRKLTNEVEHLQTNAAETTPLHLEIFSLRDELSWLLEMDKIEAFAKNTDSKNIEKLYRDLSTLEEKATTALELLNESISQSELLAETEKFSLKPPAFLSRTFVDKHASKDDMFSTTSYDTEPSPLTHESGAQGEDISISPVVESEPQSTSTQPTPLETVTKQQVTSQAKAQETRSEQPQTTDTVLNEFTSNNVLKPHIYGEDIASPFPELTQLEGETSREFLLRLTKERDMLEKKWRDVYADLSQGVALGNPHGEAKLLRARIELLNEKMHALTNVALEKHTEQSTFHSRIQELTGEEEKVATQKSDIQPAQDNSGSVNSVVTEPQAITIENPTTTLSTEDVKGKQRIVGNLMTLISRFPSSKNGVLGILAGGIQGTKNSLEKGTASTEPKQQKGRTLADEINKLSWRTTLDENVPRQFLADFNGPKPKSFDDFIKTYAPAFAIGPNNPSAKDRVANLLCEDVYDIEGANSGLSEKQQREVADMLKKLQIIIEAVGSASNSGKYEKGVRYFSGMTVRQFYEVVRKITAEADEDERRIKLRTI